MLLIDINLSHVNIIISHVDMIHAYRGRSMPALQFHSALKAPNLYPLISPIGMNNKSTSLIYISEKSIKILL